MKFYWGELSIFLIQSCILNFPSKTSQVLSDYEAWLKAVRSLPSEFWLYFMNQGPFQETLIGENLRF
jgi:hypothetical protein